MKNHLKIFAKIMAFWFLTLLILSAFSDIAHAADATPLTAQDLESAALSANHPELSAISFSEKLFGDIALNPLRMIGEPNTILSKVLIVINLSLMALAGVFMSWTLVKGSLMTSYEGKALGKQMHSAWVPFRLTVGVASLVPFFKGLCFAQLVMLQAIQISIGAGNMAWEAAVTYVYNGNMVVNPTRATSNSDLTRNLFNSLLCQHSVNYGLVMMRIEPEFGNSIKDGKWQFGSHGGAGTECGVFELPNSGNTNLSKQNASQRIESFSNLLNSLDSEAGRIAKGVFLAQVDPQNNELPKANNTYLAQASAASYSELTAITSALVKQANTGEHKGELLDGAETAARTQGFTTAGAWFFGLASKNKKASDAISQEVKLGKAALPPSATQFIGANGVYEGTAGITSASLILGGDVKYDYSNENYALKAIKSAICGDNSPKTASGVNQTLGQCIVTKTLSASDLANQNALIRIADLGNSIVAIGAASLTALGVAKGALDGVDKSIVANVADWAGAGVLKGGIKGGVDVWLQTLTEAVKVLLFFGLVCATYVPLIPAIVWIFRMVTICAVWVEAVVSAPVWAFAHLDTDGEGMGSRSGHGYLFLLNVVLNPMLSVLGLVLGTVLLDIMTSFVLILYPDMISNAAGDNWTGLLSIIAYLIIFVVINLNLVNVCMQLINVIPDNIMDWIGGRASGSLGKGQEDAIGGAVKNAMQGGGWISRGNKGNTAASKKPKVE